MTHEQTRKREVMSLTEAMIELNLSSSIIVTREEENQIQKDGRTIMIIPIWRFLLEMKSLKP